MKLFLVPLLLGAATVAAEKQPLKQVRSLYILPMASGMDQYLANKITRQGLFLVVTDPQRADAILTDRIGETLEGKIEELYPAPPPTMAVKGAKSGEEAAADGKDAVASGHHHAPAERNDMNDMGMNDMGMNDMDMMVITGPPINHPSSFGRGKGTVFLVDRKSRALIWSTYDRPKNKQEDTLDKTADQIVHRLKHDLNAKGTR